VKRNVNKTTRKRTKNEKTKGTKQKRNEIKTKRIFSNPRERQQRTPGLREREEVIREEMLPCTPTASLSLGKEAIIDAIIRLRSILLAFNEYCTVQIVMHIK
jgi:hypothetical protein